MDPKQFKDFCDEWKKKGAMDFTRRSHYEPMAPLFEAHAEVVECTVKDFHNLGKGWDSESRSEFTTYYPKKETVDKFSIAAGFSFAAVNIGTRKDSPTTFVGKAQVKMLGPDGQEIMMAPAESEYDARDRADLEILADLKKKGAESKYHESKPTSNIEKEMCFLNHKKKARPQCDTGARTRAIIAAVGMPTGFRDLFKGRDTVYFLFSRIIYNAKNKMVMDRALDSMFGAAKLLAGPTEVPGSGDDFEEEPEMRPAEGQHTTAPMRSANEPADVGEMSAAQLAALDAAAEEGFGDAPVKPTAQDIEDMSKDQSPRGRIRYLRFKYDKDLPNNGKTLIDTALDDDRTTDARFKRLYELATPELAKKGITLPAW
jgi:hypothetical protein